MPPLSDRPLPPRARPLLALLAVPMLLAGCQETPTNAWLELPSGAVRWQVTPARDSAFRRAAGVLPGPTTLLERRGFVVRDSAHWVAVWDSIWTLSVSPRRLPLVDFETEMVIVAAAGQAPPGFRISIEGVYLSPEGLWVRVLDGYSEARCILDPGPVPDTRQPYPVALALVPARPEEPRYLVRGGALSCFR
jgi:hypothetical protein